jgi:hypothetical protein
MKPTLRELASALRFTAQLLDADYADYCFEGRFRFDLDGDWSLVISPDDAGRFRIEACLRSRVRCTLWCASQDRARLERLVLSAKREAAALRV